MECSFENNDLECKKDYKTKCGALVLAAGKGTRMKSTKPKVMQPLLEEPMMYYVLKALKEAGIQDIAVVVGYGGDMVKGWLDKEFPEATVVWQHEQLGTGHAVQMAKDWIQNQEKVMVINGDMPMIQAETISKFISDSDESQAQTSFVTCALEDPTGYGRVIRGAKGSVKIVEHKDATPEEQLVREINVGIYMFQADQLLKDLGNLNRNNSQGEYYLVDLISIGCERGDQVSPILLCSQDLSGVNDPYELALLSEQMRLRVLKKHMLQGLKCLDVSSVWISPRARFLGESTLYPNVQIWGETSIGTGCQLESNTTIRSSAIGDNVKTFGNVIIEHSKIDSNVKLGPFCYIRENSHVHTKGFVGKFVEIKNSTISENAKVPHLSYIGDATIGTNTNIGAATVTCNYDGKHKHKTVIGDNCFIGSDTMFVAPVSIGDDSIVAAGSIITEDVPPDTLAIARSRQTNIGEWSKKKRSKLEA